MNRRLNTANFFQLAYYYGKATAATLGSVCYWIGCWCE